MAIKNTELISNILLKTGLIKDGIPKNATEMEVENILRNANPQVENGMKKQDITLKSNEWLGALSNKILRIITIDQLKSINTFSRFNKGANLNGITEFIAMNVMTGVAYSKETTIDQFNPKDIDLELEYLVDQFKEYYPIAFSGAILLRAFTTGANFQSFISKYVGIIVKSSALKLYERVVAMVDTYSFKKEVLVERVTNDSEATNKRIAKALETNVNKLSIPSVDYNETGFYSSATIKDVEMFTNVERSGEMTVDILASLFNAKRIGSLNVSKTDIIYSDNDIYAKVFDSDKLVFGMSVNSSTTDNIGLNLKVINALHIWSGFLMLKSFSGFVLKVVDKATPKSEKTVLEGIHEYDLTKDELAEGVKKYNKKMNSLRIEPTAEKDSKKIDEQIKEQLVKLETSDISEAHIQEMVDAKVASIVEGKNESFDKLLSDKVNAALEGK